MINRPLLKARGKYAFKNNYWLAVLAGIIYMFFDEGYFNIFKITVNLNNGMGYRAFTNSYEANKQFIDAYAAKGIGFIMMTTPMILAFSIFIGMPFLVGAKKFFLNNAEGRGVAADFTFAFSHDYLNIVKAEFFKIFWIFIWSLLFFIPGIIKAYAYSMTEFILAENPDMDATEVLKHSEEMMQGHKWELFVFQLSFIGWILLGAIIGLVNIFWTQPYMLASETEYYRTLSGKTDDGMYNFGRNNPAQNYATQASDEAQSAPDFEIRNESAKEAAKEDSENNEKEFVFKK